MAQIELDTERDLWDRQPKEPADRYDWFLHWRDDGERRSYARTADRTQQTTKAVRYAAWKFQWEPRLSAWKKAQSEQIQARFGEVVERALVPWAQAATKMIEHALRSDKPPPADRALNAATEVIRLAKEPTVHDLIRIAEAGSEQQSSPVTSAIMSALQDYPEARAAAIEAVRTAEQGRS